MSFDNLGSKNATHSAPVWQQYRNEFPVTEKSIYLNHAAVGPLSRRSANAMRELADDVLFYGSAHYAQWMDAYHGVRVAAARLIGAHSSEIALMKNTSEGIATVAMGLDWRPGDRIVGFREEFPANILPWKRLEQNKGVQLELLSLTDPMDRIEEACCGARLLAVSFVNYLSGYRADLRALGEIARRRNCFFFVDAIQGMGVFPLDVEKYRIDALAADGHKWMCGPEGCGILYVRQSRQDEIDPAEFGWTNIANYNAYDTQVEPLRPDAGRYEPGTLNTIGCYGLRAAIELLLEVGVDRISEQVRSLTDQLAAGVRERGYEVLGERTTENAAGIISFRDPEEDSRLIVRRLRDAGIQAVPRQGWVRMSPHFYLSSQDMDKVLSELG